MSKYKYPFSIFMKNNSINQVGFMSDILAVVNRNPEVISDILLACGNETTASVLNFVGSKISTLEFKGEIIKDLHGNLTNAGMFLIDQLNEIEKECKKNDRPTTNSIEPQ